MRKYIKKRLSLKIFFLTAFILVSVAALTYGFVAYFMPVIYTDSLNKNLSERAEKLSKVLQNCKFDQGVEFLQEFCMNYQSDIVLLDEDGHILYEESYPVYEESDVLETGDAAEEDANSYEGEAYEGDGAVSEESVYSVAESSTEDTQYAASRSAVAGESQAIEASSPEKLEESAMARYVLSFKGDTKKYTLLVFGSREPVNQTVKALKKVIPWLAVSVFLVAFLVALFYSRYLANPVIYLSRISEKMAKLDFNVESTLKREDEIGNLSKSLNTLAANLDSALTELKAANEKLKNDMEKEREQEKKRMEFFAASSHELKTPVTILKGQIEGMIEGVGSYRDRDKSLLRAKEVTETLQSMVQEILTISKMESSGFALKKTDTDMAELFRIHLADLNPLFEKKNMKMDIYLPESLRWEVDSSLMMVVVRNLLVNAVRYSPAGEKICVRLFQDNREMTGQVENFGVQIPGEKLDKVFDAFYRVDTSRNSKSGGSGLGLYIVRGILEQHQGTYKIENTAAGVQFTFCIPKNL